MVQEREQAITNGTFQKLHEDILAKFLQKISGDTRNSLPS